MFKSMRLKNFKAYKDSGEIPLAPLTIIVGANNSGKSTLFHALLVLVQTARASARVGENRKTPGLVTKGELVDLNGYYDIIHGRSRASTSSFEISIGIVDIPLPPWNFTIPNHADFVFRFDPDQNEIALARSTLRGNERLSISAERRNGSWSLNTPLPATLENPQLDFRNLFPFLRPEKVTNSTQNTFLDVIVPTYYIADFWYDLLAKRIRHISPLRDRVPWYVGVGVRTESQFGSGGGNLVADLSSNEKDRNLNQTQLEFVSDWFAQRKILKRVYLEHGNEANVRMLVGDECSGPKKINIAAMGEGLSQVLPIVAYAKFGMNDDCLLIEEPESHIHPGLQAELGELFMDVALTGHRQILVETHSEYLVTRVRRRVAEGKLKPDQVAILFVEKEGSESTVRRLNMTERGHFSDWPQGFFDEAYQESMALAHAANKKGR